MNRYKKIGALVLALMLLITVAIVWSFKHTSSSQIVREDAWQENNLPSGSRFEGYEDHEEEGEDANLADPLISKLVTEDTKNKAWLDSNSAVKVNVSENNSIQVNDALSVSYPRALTEDSIYQQANQSAIDYAAQHFSEPILDGLYHSYYSDGEHLMGVMGIEKTCSEGNACAYNIGKDSALLNIAKDLQVGDKINSINGVAVSKLSGFNLTKQVLFKQNPTVVVVESTTGAIKQIKVNHV